MGRVLLSIVLMTSMTACLQSPEPIGSNNGDSDVATENNGSNNGDDSGPDAKDPSDMPDDGGVEDAAVEDADGPDDTGGDDQGQVCDSCTVGESACVMIDGTMHHQVCSNGADEDGGSACPLLSSRPCGADDVCTADGGCQCAPECETVGEWNCDGARPLLCMEVEGCLVLVAACRAAGCGMGIEDTDFCAQDPQNSQCGGCAADGRECSELTACGALAEPCFVCGRDVTP